MFTGIIEATAPILKRTSDSITVGRPKAFTDLKRGCSVAVAGTCLTVIGLTKNAVEFEVMPETWSVTTLGSLKVGQKVNLERAMKADGRFDGHIVQGHIEGRSKVEGRRLKNGLLTLDCEASLVSFIVPKGSITIDGVSLTVASIKKNHVTVALIPETLRMTTLGSLKKGDKVNIETDVIGRYIKSMV